MNTRWWDEPMSSQMPRPSRTEVLDRVKVGRETRLGSWSRLEVSERWSDLMHDTVLSVEAELLRQKLPPAQVVESADVEMVRPARWLDHLKLTVASRWWARWWVRRWPARVVAIPHRLTVVVDLEGFRTFPQANGDPQEWGWLGEPHLVVEVRTTPRLR